MDTDTTCTQESGSQEVPTVDATNASKAFMNIMSGSEALAQNSTSSEAIAEAIASRIEPNLSTTEVVKRALSMAALHSAGKGSDVFKHSSMLPNLDSIRRRDLLPSPDIVERPSRSIRISTAPLGPIVLPSQSTSTSPSRYALSSFRPVSATKFLTGEWAASQRTRDQAGKELTQPETNSKTSVSRVQNSSVTSTLSTGPRWSATNFTPSEPHTQSVDEISLLSPFRSRSPSPKGDEQLETCEGRRCSTSNGLTTPPKPKSPSPSNIRTPLPSAAYTPAPDSKEILLQKNSASITRGRVSLIPSDSTQENNAHSNLTRKGQRPLTFSSVPLTPPQKISYGHGAILSENDDSHGFSTTTTLQTDPTCSTGVSSKVKVQSSELNHKGSPEDPHEFAEFSEFYEFDYDADIDTDDVKISANNESPILHIEILEQDYGKTALKFHKEWLEETAQPCNLGYAHCPNHRFRTSGTRRPIHSKRRIIIDALEAGAETLGEIIQHIKSHHEYYQQIAERKPEKWLTFYNGLRHDLSLACDQDLVHRAGHRGTYHYTIYPAYLTPRKMFRAMDMATEGPQPSRARYEAIKLDLAEVSAFFVHCGFMTKAAGIPPIDPASRRTIEPVSIRIAALHEATIAKMRQGTYRRKQVERGKKIKAARERKSAGTKWVLPKREVVAVGVPDLEGLGDSPPATTFKQEAPSVPTHRDIPTDLIDYLDYDSSDWDEDVDRYFTAQHRAQARAKVNKKAAAARRKAARAAAKKNNPKPPRRRSTRPSTEIDGSTTEAGSSSAAPPLSKLMINPAPVSSIIPSFADTNSAPSIPLPISNGTAMSVAPSGNTGTLADITTPARPTPPLGPSKATIASTPVDASTPAIPSTPIRASTPTRASTPILESTADRVLTPVRASIPVRASTPGVSPTLATAIDVASPSRLAFSSNTIFSEICSPSKRSPSTRDNSEVSESPNKRQALL